MQRSDNSAPERIINLLGLLIWLGGFVWLTTTPAAEMPTWLGVGVAYWLIILAALLFWMVTPVIKGIRTGDFPSAFMEALRSLALALIIGAVIWFIVSKLG